VTHLQVDSECSVPDLLAMLRYRDPESGLVPLVAPNLILTGAGNVMGNAGGPVAFAEPAEPPDATQHTGGAVALGPVALLTRGLPEYEARRGGGGDELCLTLLRCVGTISKPTGALSTRPLGAGPDLPTPEGQCLGRHELEYALLVGADELDDAQLLRESQDYRRGFLVITGAAAAFDPPLAIEGDVVFSCLKGSEDGDGLILRCFNPTASPVAARVIGPVSVSRARLDEADQQSVPGGVTEVGPYEIATLRVRPQ